MAIMLRSGYCYYVRVFWVENTKHLSIYGGKYINLQG
jgi:hypothetical protein